jgi:hypothetical protein
METGMKIVLCIREIDTGAQHELIFGQEHS